MLRRLIRALQRPAARRKARPSTHRPRVGAFEERVLLSTFNWTAGVNGNFNVAANWTAQPGNIHGVPGPNDTAANNTNCDITVDNSASVGAWVDGVDNGAGELILNTGVTLTITGGSGNTALNSTI